MARQRVTTIQSFDALAVATAGGDADTIAAVAASRLTYMDRSIEVGTKMILDFKAPFTIGDGVIVDGKTWKNLYPAGGDAVQATAASLSRVNNGSGRMIGLSYRNNTSIRLPFPASTKLPSGVARCGWAMWVTFTEMGAAGSRHVAGWGDSTSGAARAFSLILNSANTLSIGVNGQSLPLLTPTLNTPVLVGVEAVFNGTSSIQRGFVNNEQVGSDLIFDGTSGLRQPSSDFGLGGVSGYYSTANMTVTAHRAIVEDLGASGRTMAELMSLEHKRYQTRFVA